MEPYLNEIQLEKLNGHLEIILNDFEVFKKDKLLSNDKSKKSSIVSVFSFSKTD